MHAGVQSSAFTIKRILGLGLIWMLATVSVFIVLPMIAGREVIYSSDVLLVAATFLVWIGIVLILFPHTTTHVFLENSLRSYGLLALFLAFVYLFYAYAVPALDPVGDIAKLYGLENGTFLRGGDGYVFVKTLEILLQQILITGIILSLASHKKSFIFVSTMFALLFGLTHLALLPSMGVGLALIFTAAAGLSAVVFPYLILYVRNGFVYTYIIHWFAYVLITPTLLWMPATFL